MPVVDIMDSTWVRARPQAVGVIVADPTLWRRWWPGLDLAATEQRGEKGIRWDVASVDGVAGMTGTAELWLQAQGDGVVVHFFLRLDPSAALRALPAPYQTGAVGARRPARPRAPGPARLRHPHLADLIRPAGCPGSL